MSSPWHLSNLSYLKLSPPASRWLISPDTSHRPDRESLYPENNPPLLTLHPKSVPPPFMSVFLIFLFTFSFPIYPFPITSLWPTLPFMFPSVFVKPYSAPFLSFSIFPPPVFSSPSSLPWEVYRAPVDVNLWKETVIADWGIACISLRAHLHSKKAFYSTGGCC